MWQAEVRVDLDAIRDNVALLRAGTTAEVMAVVKADGYGHGMLPAARAALDGGADLARRLHPRRGADAAPGRHHRAGAGLAARPGPAAARGGRRRRRPERGEPGPARRDDRGRPAWPAGRPGSTSRSTPACPGAARPPTTGRRWSRRPRRPRPTARSRSVGVWSHFVYADAPGHATIDRQLAVFAEALGRGRAARHPAALPAHRQLGRHADPPGHPLRPGPPRASPSTGCRRSPGEHVRPAAGDDRPGPGDADQAGAGRHRRLVRAHLLHRRGRPRWPWCRSATPTGCPGTPPTPARSQLGGRIRTDRRPGLHGPDRARLRRRPGRRRATWRRCSAAATTASPPPTTGPRRSARSTTRSSPGSAASGCPGSTTGSPRCPVSARVPEQAESGRTALRAGRAAGILGAVVGVAAAGVATGVAVERAVVRRAKAVPGDPYADEEFGDLPYDERVTVTDRRRHRHPRRDRRADRRRRPARPTVVFVHGFCLDMGTFHFQRKALGRARRAPDGLLRPARPRPLRPARVRRVRAAALGETLRAVIDADRAGRPARPGRSLDGRHDDHGVRRAATRRCSTTGWSASC